MIRSLLFFTLLATSPKPPPPPSALADYIGEYGTGIARIIVFETRGHLETLQGTGGAVEIKPDTPAWIFHRDSEGRIDSLNKLPRTAFPEGNAVFRVRMQRPLDELRKESATRRPPFEPGPFRKTNLVELASLDPAIHLEIRYATDDNFLGAPLYSQARAFLQRPAAIAVQRAAGFLRPLGYGLLIHDAYRPWYITWMFWQATPPKQRMFLANPVRGSKHNRGCAVDLSMYDLATGKPVDMPSVYDEMTHRAFATYPGGTELQRWRRQMLREAMENEGFVPNPTEWWHFDYKDWKQYRIGTDRFEDLSQ